MKILKNNKRGEIENPISVTLARHIIEIGFRWIHENYTT